MPLRAGTHALGNDSGSLTVRTTRAGAAAKAGHDLLIEVGAWEAAVVAGGESDVTAVSLTADGGSLRVLEGTGGIQALGEDDRVSISQTIDDEVLRRSAIEFRSSAVETGADGRRLTVRGELELLGERRPIEFELTLQEHRLTGSATVRQTDWGIKPYSTLFGTLKVADEVVVAIDASL